MTDKPSLTLIPSREVEAILSAGLAGPKLIKNGEQYYAYAEQYREWKCSQVTSTGEQT